ncbi:hypothetical protein [Rhizobium sp. RU36D]|uniref:hypothetical protein n=1 Tax=Rhizobium sp. RU36D TaxID=1907415 RepID=UPI0009D84A92|nr:hypothetical protein [Rhizobium sp. RU36D]SMD15156.1 hypothetical protein SAMN05880593_12741 [Rhizobium sp. RU36D]
MLPPVISVPSSQISYQEQRPLIEIAGGAHANAAAPQMVAPSALDQSAVAARLNMLLLSGRERMAENLAMLAEVFGSAIDVTRKEGESSLAFAMRLAEAIAALPLSQRVKLEGQLARALSGAQLRMLLAALKNPEGADAAKLSMLIELARTAERDLAARSVVTSYRQNAAEAKSEAHNPPSAARTASPATAAEQLTAPDATETATTPAPLPMPEAENTATPATAAAKPALKSDVAAPEANAPKTALSEGADEAQEQAADAPEEMLDLPEDVELATTSASPERLIAERSDAHGLQVLLQRSFAAELPTPSAEELTQAEPATDPAPHAEAELDLETASTEREMPQAALSDMEEYSPRSELRRATDTAKSIDRPQTTLLVLKGWQEVDSLLHLVPEDQSQAPGRALVAQAIQAAGVKDMDGLTASSHEPAQPEAMEQKRRGASEAGIWPEEPIDSMDRDGPTQRSFPETILSQWRALEDQFSALRPPFDLPDSAVLPVVSYLFADEAEEEATSEKPRRRDDEEPADQQASGERGEGGNQQRQRDEEPAAETTEDVAADMPSGISADAERANDLYWRMAGWS